MQKTEIIKKKVESQNTWYTTDQIHSSFHRSLERITEARHKFFYKTIFEHTKLKKNPIVLDAGCGDGTNLISMNTIPGLIVCGIDYNPLRITRAKNKLQETSIIQGDLLKLPFKEQTFDVILLNHVLEHIPEDSVVLHELNRSLKQDGLLIVGVPNEGCILGQLRNKIIQRNILKTTDHVHFYTEQYMISLLNSDKWFIKEIRREGFFTPFTYLHNFLTMFDLTFSILDFMKRKFPSQCAGLHFICEKGGENDELSFDI